MNFQLIKFHTKLIKVIELGIYEIYSEHANIWLRGGYKFMYLLNRKKTFKEREL